MTRRKQPVWDGIDFVIEFGPTGEVLNSTELSELLNQMMPSIIKLAHKTANKIKLDADDVQQALFLVTLDLLESWDATQSKWGTYWTNYAYRRTLTKVNTIKGGYRLRELANTGLLEAFSS
jgi:hypothetical protein